MRGCRLLALPTAGLARPAKISPHASPVSEAGVATVEAANPNPYALRGKAIVTAGRRTVFRRAVKLAKRSVKRITLRFDAGAMSALRATGGPVRITLRLPAESAPPPVADRWVGRLGTEGAYDDLELTLTGGQIQITKAPMVPVSCFENGGSYRSAISLELFTAPGPWTVGTDGSVAQQGTRIAGTLGMSFFDSKYDVFSATILFINCAGSQSFEAVPAG